MLSLGGWGGCKTCSDVFSTEANRKAFATSVKKLSKFFNIDGLDLDWEYPAIEGYPGHAYKPEDRENFTELVHTLRKTLGKEGIISFAAGGFQKFIDQSIEWKKVMKDVDMVNLMTYDLVNGYSTITGHHTALYSTDQQVESADKAVERLLKIGIPANKMVIGAAFYGRVWEKVPPTNNGLYQQGVFKTSVDYKNFPNQLSADKGFVEYWDSTAQAPYIYNASQNLFVTYDNKQSIRLKTQYAKAKGLKGIMFWELSLDTSTNGLLDTIDQTKKE
jgi:chitinase